MGKIRLSDLENIGKVPEHSKAAPEKIVEFHEPVKLVLKPLTKSEIKIFKGIANDLAPVLEFLHKKQIELNKATAANSRSSEQSSALFCAYSEIRRAQGRLLNILDPDYRSEKCKCCDSNGKEGWHSWDCPKFPHPPRKLMKNLGTDYGGVRHGLVDVAPRTEKFK